MSEPNMLPLRSSRKRIHIGDVFIVKFAPIGYIFGRVAATELPIKLGVMPRSNLLYFYDYKSDAPVPVREELRPNRLLIPPVLTNRLGWSRGYFETVTNWPLADDEDPEQFCFEDTIKNIYRTLSGKLLAERVEPCGSLGLCSYLRIDDLLSDALGIPRAPVDPE